MGEKYKMRDESSHLLMIMVEKMAYHQRKTSKKGMRMIIIENLKIG